jgi:hypothetical protein
MRNELLLEELTMAHKAHTPASALYSATTGAQASPGGQPPALRLSRPPLAPLPRPRHTSTTDSSRRPRKGGRGVAVPHAEVPLAGAAARTGRLSTTPGPAPSPCGRVRPPVPLALGLRHRPS